MTVEAEKSNAIPRLHTSRTQCSRQTPHTFSKLGIGKAQILAHYRCLMGKLLFCVAKEAHRCQGKIHREFFLPGRLASVDDEYVSRHVCRSFRCQKYCSAF